MGEWVETTLGDHIHIKHGYAFKGKSITKEPTNDILVTPGNFYIGGGFKADKFKYFNSDYPESYILNKNDIIVTMTDLSKEGDTLGYAAKIPEIKGKNFLHNQRIGLVEFLSNYVNSNFIYWLMRTRDYQGFIIGAASGTSIRHTSPTSIKSYGFLLPPLPEQKAIASVLSSLDDKIDLLHRQNKTLESIAETLFRQWFIEEAQEDWNEVSISDVAKTNISTIKSDYLHKEILYLDTGSITEGKIDSLQSYELSDAPSRAKRLVKHNDIIISTVRPNHRHYGFIKNPLSNLVVSTGFCVISCTKIDPNFMYSLLTLEDMTKYLSILAEASTSTYPSLKPSDIEAIEFKIPPNYLLEKFSGIISGFWKKIENNQHQIKTLESLRNTLLSKLMSGDIRVEYEKVA